MKIGILAGILSQTLFGLLASESLKVYGISTEALFLALGVLIGFVFTLFCGSMKNSGIRREK